MAMPRFFRSAALVHDKVLELQAALEEAETRAGDAQATVSELTTTVQEQQAVIRELEADLCQSRGDAATVAQEVAALEALVSHRAQEGAALLAGDDASQEAVEAAEALDTSGTAVARAQHMLRAAFSHLAASKHAERAQARRLERLEAEARYAEDLQAQLMDAQAREATAAAEVAAVAELRGKLASAERVARQAGEQVEALAKAKLSAEQARDVLANENLKLMTELTELEGRSRAAMPDHIVMRKGAEPTTPSVAAGGFAIVKTPGQGPKSAKKPLVSLMDQENASTAFVPVKKPKGLSARPLADANANTNASFTAAAKGAKTPMSAHRSRVSESLLNLSAAGGAAEDEAPECNQQ